jgi:hypothetical protein
VFLGVDTFVFQHQALPDLSTMSARIAAQTFGDDHFRAFERQVEIVD